MQKCSFCDREFEPSRHVLARKASDFTCLDCRSISASYSSSSSTISKRDFYLARRPKLHSNVRIDLTIDKYGHDPRRLGSASKKKVISSCEFCCNLFDTSLSCIRDSSVCKKCDSLAASYSRSKSTEDKSEYYKNFSSVVDTKNIDRDATLQKFGYSIESISKFSHKPVIAKCFFCEDRLEIPYSKYNTRNGVVVCKKDIRKKTVRTLKEKYGVECTLDIPAVRESLITPSTERLVASVLKDRYSVEFIPKYVIGPYEFDFFIPSLNLLIECQGDYFHDFKTNGYSGLPKDRAKSSYIENNTSFKLIWIYEHEIHLGRINKILDFHIHKIVEPDVSLDLKDLNFREISSKEAHVFLSSYHYLGNIGGVSKCYGAFLGELLISVAVFGGVTRNQSIKRLNDKLQTNFGPKDIRELRRFCIRPNVKARNVASYSLKRFIGLLGNARAILSFADSTVNDIGTIYKASNWKELGTTGVSYHYLDPSTNKVIHKKTVWDQAKSNHMKENDFFVSAGLIKIPEKAKTVWVQLL